MTSKPANMNIKASEVEAVNRQLADYLSGGLFDFIDFGCSNGGSLIFGHDRLGGERGFGIDLSPSKIEQARAAGFQACVADARQLALHPDSVRFVTMMDFLEHLPGYKDAMLCIEAACAAARQFIFIQQPWFDSDGYLFRHGLKLYWSDWYGHPNAMTSLEIQRIMRGVAKVSRWRLYGRTPILTSMDPCVHPLSSPTDQHKWIAGQHEAKKTIKFTEPVYRQIGCIAILNDDTDLLDELEHRVGWSSVLFDSLAS